MKLELKNVKINEQFSEETIMFKADLFVDGKKIAYAQNDGHGGCTYYNAYENKREALKEVEDFVSKQPDIVYEYRGEKHSLPSTLEHWIDEEVDKILERKEQAKTKKRIEKACETYIVWGVPNGDSFQKWGFKTKVNLAEVYKQPHGKVAIDNLVKKVKAELEEGEVIFNTNIPI